MFLLIKTESKDFMRRISSFEATVRFPELIISCFLFSFFFFSTFIHVTIFSFQRSWTVSPFAACWASFTLTSLNCILDCLAGWRTDPSPVKPAPARSHRGSYKYAETLCASLQNFWNIQIFPSSLAWLDQFQVRFTDTVLLLIYC